MYGYIAVGLICASAGYYLATRSAYLKTKARILEHAAITHIDETVKNSSKNAMTVVEDVLAAIKKHL
jgi:hypothetical protein